VRLTSRLGVWRDGGLKPAEVSTITSTGSGIARGRFAGVIGKCGHGAIKKNLQSEHAGTGRARLEENLWFVVPRNICKDKSLVKGRGLVVLSFGVHNV